VNSAFLPTRNGHSLASAISCLAPPLFGEGHDNQ